MTTHFPARLSCSELLTLANALQSWNRVHVWWNHATLRLFMNKLHWDRLSCFPWLRFDVWLKWRAAVHTRCLQGLTALCFMIDRLSENLQADDTWECNGRSQSRCHCNNKVAHRCIGVTEEIRLLAAQEHMLHCESLRQGRWGNRDKAKICNTYETSMAGFTLSKA